MFFYFFLYVKRGLSGIAFLKSACKGLAFYPYLFALVIKNIECRYRHLYSHDRKRLWQIHKKKKNIGSLFVYYQ